MGPLFWEQFGLFYVLKMTLRITIKKLRRGTHGYPSQKKGLTAPCVPEFEKLIHNPFFLRMRNSNFGI